MLSQPRIPSLVALGAATVVSLGLCILCFGAWNHARGMSAASPTVSARVVDTRSVDQGGDEVFELQYAFDVDGSGTYSAGNGVWSSGLWAPVSAADWAIARDLGWVEVQYAAGAPSVNRPVSAAPAYQPQTGPGWLALVSALVFLGSLGGWGVAWSHRKDAAKDVLAMRERAYFFWASVHD